MLIHKSSCFFASLLLGVLKIVIILSILLKIECKKLYNLLNLKTLDKNLIV
ncbi:hypothetical protein THERMOS_2208 [Bathymodiolus thermophilus thioautotrophic gill symbiont]|uniref:Uncharacterized protein n=1 Tax=Bathymodiolus thermophilus thioautotrophic gill symbiont TaxID=2360 RepID=A0A8H8XG96_9GAMM|nr:hypothetical protein THERMOS_2208 [Bathymodiolus thermophilus thioautotrophic gill symbiont]